MSNKNAPESCQQPAGEMKLQVNDQQMGYNNGVGAVCIEPLH